MVSDFFKVKFKGDVGNSWEFWLKWREFHGFYGNLKIVVLWSLFWYEKKNRIIEVSGACKTQAPPTERQVIWAR